MAFRALPCLSARRKLAHTHALDVKKREVIRFGDYKARIICRSCNRHFGELEERVKPLLVPILDGNATSLAPDEQELVARWALKTTCALLGVERRFRQVPKRQRIALRTRGSVPRTCFVGLGKYTATGILIVCGRLKIKPGRGVPEDRVISAYHSTLAFGHAVLRVFGAIRPEADDTFRIPPGRLCRVWPSSDENVPWPPLWPLDSDEVRDLASYNHLILR